MEVGAWKKATKEYIDNTVLIRKLSSTQVAPESTQQAYYEELRDNFMRIREIADRNKKILGEVIYPCLDGEELLPGEMVGALNEFMDRLIDGADMLSLDTIMVIRVAERLIKDARKKEDVSYLIRQLDAGLIAYYTAYNMLNRTTETESLGEEYSRRGEEIGRELMGYVEKDRFAALPDKETKGLILTDSRYSVCFCETKSPNPEKAAAGVEHIKWARRIAQDPFYHEQVPSYDWFYHRVRLCEYACTMTQVGNVKGLTKEQCQSLLPYARELDRLITEDVEGVITVYTARILSARVKYYAGEITLDEYMRILRELYGYRKKNSYYIDDVYMNLIIPTEYITEVRKIPNPTEEIYSDIANLYRDVVRYISRTQNDETLGASLEYYADFLNNFLEYPGGMTFYDMVMLSLAGMHLPTYVHANMVGKISLCIARHMLYRNPGYFVGLWGIEDEAGVAERSGEILDFIYHAGVLHDAGKLFIIDTVFVYGRKLLDAEFNIIKNHPAAGETLLRKYQSTASYASIAAAHHKFADNRGGYPAAFDLDAMPEKKLAKIVMVADGMDAATDSVGRSYGKGISLEQFIGEVWEDRGGRYDEDVARILREDETLQRDIAYILSHERQTLYYKSYDLMFRNFRED